MPNFKTAEDLRNEIINRFIYQPVGILTAVVKALPNATEEGKKALTGPVQTAQFVGQMAAGVVKARYGKQISDVEQRVDSIKRGVDQIRNEAFKSFEERISVIFPWSSAPASTKTESKPSAEHAEAPTETASDNAGPADVDNGVVGGIEGYSQLTSAQILEKLDDLDLDDLAEVENFELSHRRRRTVLARISKIREERN
jgi:hypothetical protein